MSGKCMECGRATQDSAARCEPCIQRRLKSIIPVKEVFDDFMETFNQIGPDGIVMPNPPDEEIFVNSIYQVNRRSIGGNPECIHLSIKRIDKAACKDWRHFQWIKNQILGPEWCGVEFYPPESHLVDTSNQYHLWCFESDEWFGFTWKERLVSELSSGGAVQRKWPDHMRPTDLISQGELDEKLKKYKENQP